MRTVFLSFLSVLFSCFQIRASLQAENLALRHPINVLRRGVRRRLRLSSADRLSQAQAMPPWVGGGIWSHDSCWKFDALFKTR